MRIITWESALNLVQAATYCSSAKLSCSIYGCSHGVQPVPLLWWLWPRQVPRVQGVSAEKMSIYIYCQHNYLLISITFIIFYLLYLLLVLYNLVSDDAANWAWQTWHGCGSNSRFSWWTSQKDSKMQRLSVGVLHGATLLNLRYVCWLIS